MQNVKSRLDAWREAERRRDALAHGGAEWQAFDEEVRSAAKLYHAELAQASARYAEAEFQAGVPWSVRPDRRTSGAGDWVVGAIDVALPEG